MTPVAVYRRIVRASLARVWENVLDWEHLPWLHASTFAHVRLLARSPAGWRAESALRRDPSQPFVLEVTLDRPARCYHARTLTGPGEGTDIVTHLAPVDASATAIAVEFHVPGVPPALVQAVGDQFVHTYARLWDEDEAMMVRRQQVIDGTLPERTRVVVVGADEVAVSATCPHRGGPLDGPADADGCITCPWHGYRFDVRSGRQVGGSLRLPASAAATRAVPRR